MLPVASAAALGQQRRHYTHSLPSATHTHARPHHTHLVVFVSLFPPRCSYGGARSFSVILLPFAANEKDHLQTKDRIADTKQLTSAVIGRNRPYN